MEKVTFHLCFPTRSFECALYINKTFLIQFGILRFLKLRKEYRTKSLSLKVLHIFKLPSIRILVFTQKYTKCAHDAQIHIKYSNYSASYSI